MNIVDYWWLLMNIDEYWWILMNIDEYWWTMLIMDKCLNSKHCFVDTLPINKVNSPESEALALALALF